MVNLIEATNLVKNFHGREIVKGVDLEIHKGETLALIGPNGAGKSTLMSMLLGIIKPDKGTINRWREDYRSHLGVQLQSTPFFEGYTAEENLELFAALYKVKLTKAQLLMELEKCGLAEVRKTPAIRMSIGQQKRLAIAVTNIHHPELIVLDEPTAGLDPRARHEIREVIRSLSKENVTVIFSSHDMEEVTRTADRLILINNGKIVAQGTPVDLLQENQTENLDELYLKLTDIA